MVYCISVDLLYVRVVDRSANKLLFSFVNTTGVLLLFGLYLISYCGPLYCA